MMNLKIDNPNTNKIEEKKSETITILQLDTKILLKRNAKTTITENRHLYTVKYMIYARK